VKTETINEYLFADLVVEYARAVHAERVHGLTADQRSKDGITSEDMRKGFERLQHRRREALALLQEAQEAE